MTFRMPSWVLWTKACVVSRTCPCVLQKQSLLFLSPCMVLIRKLTVLLALARIWEDCCKKHMCCPSPNMVLISGCLLHLARPCCSLQNPFAWHHSLPDKRLVLGWPKGIQPMEGSGLSIGHGFRNLKVENHWVKL